MILIPSNFQVSRDLERPKYYLMNTGVLKALDKGSVHYSFCLKFVWLNSTIDKFLNLYNLGTSKLMVQRLPTMAQFKR